MTNHHAAHPNFLEPMNIQEWEKERDKKNAKSKG
jgi:hypothetical protein